MKQVTNTAKKCIQQVKMAKIVPEEQYLLQMLKKDSKHAINSIDNRNKCQKINLA